MNDFGSILLNSFLPSLAYQLPVLIALLVGLVIAIVRWRKTPRASLFAFLAILLVLFVTLVRTFTDSALSLILYDVFYMDFTTIGIVHSILAIVYNLLMAISWALLFAAIFSRRTTKAPAD